MKITKDDVGRKVITGDGEVEEITAFQENKLCPVETDGCHYYATNGHYGGRDHKSLAGLVGFVDEPKTTEMHSRSRGVYRQVVIAAIQDTAKAAIDINTEEYYSAAGKLIQVLSEEL